MAIKLIGNYAKRLGLPGYSSHQFSVSVEIELSDAGNIQGEAARIYQLLQDAVDREIQHTGFVPGHDYGEVTQPGQPSSRNGHYGAAPGHSNGNGNGRHAYRLNGGANGQPERWACSDKQQDLIRNLVAEHGLAWDAVEHTAQDRFGVPVARLNKLQASGLIDELLEGGNPTPAPAGRPGTNGSRSRRKGGSHP